MVSLVLKGLSKIQSGPIVIQELLDVDGAHIKNLFYTFIWNICPDLLKQGYIYAGRAPLYKITEKNGKSYTYLRNDEELKKYQLAHPSAQYDIGRMKGLGEMGITETGECLSDPKTRAIDQITVKDVEAANRAFAEMMGTSVVYRKQFLKKYGKEANYNAE